MKDRWQNFRNLGARKEGKIVRVDTGDEFFEVTLELSNRGSETERFFTPKVENHEPEVGQSAWGGGRTGRMVSFTERTKRT